MRGSPFESIMPQKNLDTSSVEPRRAVADRDDWSEAEIRDLFEMPFLDLIDKAHRVHRAHWPANQIQASTLLSIKTGRCPEDCAYCPQSVRYRTEVEEEPLLDADAVLAAAAEAKAAGAGRFCMGAAWRSPKDRDIPKLAELVRGVKALGLETCMTLGMLSQTQAERLAEAGLDYYNHNLDTSPEFYKRIISTRNYQQRLDTLEHVRDSGMKVCCGGILGMGESRRDRIRMLQQLVNLPQHPQSVPINQLVPVEGTPLEDQPPLEELEFVRTLAVARILMPNSYVRLSAGRERMGDAMQALAFMAGANSIFYGDKLLTTSNPQQSRDRRLLEDLGLAIENAPAAH